jgi:hypothetical protein
VDVAGKFDGSLRIGIEDIAGGVVVGEAETLSLLMV